MRGTERVKACLNLSRSPCSPGPVPGLAAPASLPTRRLPTLAAACLKIILVPRRSTTQTGCDSHSPYKRRPGTERLKLRQPLASANRGCFAACPHPTGALARALSGDLPAQPAPDFKSTRLRGAMSREECGLAQSFQPVITCKMVDETDIRMATSADSEVAKTNITECNECFQPTSRARDVDPFTIEVWHPYRDFQHDVPIRLRVESFSLTSAPTRTTSPRSKGKGLAFILTISL
jgi:hypothetical protein